ncbi:MAG: 4-hydroxythreonine-4-phosphate dehydrogenase PdxA [Polaromonas sp.]|nr:4-hydroxythreonine-4-phosphate dehydrogenase PdxA [Polaromonas sp.]
MAVTRPLAITMGDPAGIGPEIIAKAFLQAPGNMAGCVVVGDVATMRRASQLAGASAAAILPVAHIEAVDGWQALPPRCIPVLQKCELPVPPAYGQVSAVAGKAAADCIVWAARAALAGEVAAVVTAPIHKEALSAAGAEFARFPGHTELLQAEAAAFLGKPVAEVPVRMMLANDELKTVLVSIHLSLRDAIGAVTFDNVLQTLLITHRAVRGVAGKPPRIGVAGLNPHAGEGGLFGREELDIILPAIAAARQQGLDVSGPFAPDTVFMRARAKAGQAGEFDVVVAMYHDQGLIPVKYLGVEQGVNVTLGLPLVRTSPDHGTAFDIAGKGLADASSLLAAVRVARRLAA